MMEKLDLRIAILGLLTLLALAPGCVRRRMTVRTNPSGAMVYVDRQPIGRTPVSHSFTYYGTRHFEIVKDGYRTETFLRNFQPPVYEFPVLEFLTETLWPFEKRDQRIVDVQLVPEEIVPPEALVNSAEGLRLQASQGLAVSVAPSSGVLPSAPPAVGYPAPPLSDRYVDPTLPQNGGQFIGPPTNNSVGPPLPQGGINLPQLLTPTPSIPALNITPGNSYRPSMPN